MKKPRKESVTIASIAINDQIDVIDVLGRAAQAVTFINTTGASTECELKLNTLTKVNVENVESVDGTINYWAVSSGATTDTLADDALIATLSEADELGSESGVLSGIPIRSVEIIGLTATETGDLVFW